MANDYLEFPTKDYTIEIDSIQGVIRMHRKFTSVTEWAEATLKQFYQDKHVNFTIVGRYTYVSDDAGRTEKAKCKQTDTFETKIGVALAYARLRQLPIHPDFQNKPQTTNLTRLNSKSYIKFGTQVYSLKYDKWGIVYNDYTSSQQRIEVLFQCPLAVKNINKTQLWVRSEGEN